MLPSVLSCGQIIHVRRQTLDVFQAKILTVVGYIPVRGHVVEVLGGSDLGRCFPLEVNALILNELKESVNLAGRDKGVHRIGKQDELRIFKRCLRR